MTSSPSERGAPWLKRLLGGVGHWLAERRSLRWLIPLTVLAASVLAANGVRRSEQSDLARRSDNKARLVAIAVAEELSTRFEDLTRMAERWKLRGGTPRSEWERDAALYVEHDPAYQAIAWVDGEGQVRWVAPVEGNEAPVGTELRLDVKRREALERAVQTGDIAMTEPIELAQGGEGVLTFIPLGEIGGSEGALLAVFQLDRLFEVLLSEVRRLGYRLALGYEDRFIYRGDADAEVGDRFLATAPVALEGSSWRVMVWPMDEERALAISDLPWIIVGAGAITAALLWLALSLVMYARADAEHLAESRRQLQRQVRIRKASEAELLRSNRELESFARVASHDLQEPLRGIASFTQLLSERYGDQLDEQGQRYIQFAVDSAHRMRALILGLLDYSRIQTRGETFVRTDLDKVVRGALTNLAGRIEETGATIEVGDLPVLYADQTQMLQAVQNLVANALKYAGSASDPPQVRITSVSTDDGCVLRVSDRGPGIPEPYRDRVFEIFARLEAARSGDGSGVGLSICKRIAERHGGRIWIEDSPGGGATVALQLPLVPPGDSAGEESPAPLEMPTVPPPAPAPAAAGEGRVA